MFTGFDREWEAIAARGHGASCVFAEGAGRVIELVEVEIDGGGVDEGGHEEAPCPIGGLAGGGIPHEQPDVIGAEFGGGGFEVEGLAEEFEVYRADIFEHLCLAAGMIDRHAARIGIGGEVTGDAVLRVDGIPDATGEVEALGAVGIPDADVVGIAGPLHDTEADFADTNDRHATGFVMIAKEGGADWQAIDGDFFVGGDVKRAMCVLKVERAEMEGGCIFGQEDITGGVAADGVDALIEGIHADDGKPTTGAGSTHLSIHLLTPRFDLSDVICQ